MPQKAGVTLQSINLNVLEVLRRLDVTDSPVGTLNTSVSTSLALATGIPNIEVRLEAIDARLCGLEFRIANLATLDEHHDKSLERLGHEHVSIKATLRRLRYRFDKIKVDGLRERVRVLEEELSALEKDLVGAKAYRTIDRSSCIHYS